MSDTNINIGWTVAEKDQVLAIVTNQTTLISRLEAVVAELRKDVNDLVMLLYGNVATINDAELKTIITNIQSEGN